MIDHDWQNWQNAVLPAGMNYHPSTVPNCLNMSNGTRSGRDETQSGCCFVQKVRILLVPKVRPQAFKFNWLRIACGVTINGNYWGLMGDLKYS